MKNPPLSVEYITTVKLEINREITILHRTHRNRPDIKKLKKMEYNHELKVEEDGYMKSFALQEHEEYKAFFETYGFVVIDNILSPNECAISCQEIWSFLQHHDDNIDQENPSTWSETHWPKNICRNGGFMGKFPYWKRMANLNETFVSKQPQAWKNRENRDVYSVFAKLLCPKLWTSIDRYGVMRPKTTSELEEKEDWSTKSEWLHWDLSPFHYGTSAAGFAPKKKIDRKGLEENYGGLRVQGLITLTDCPVENGGFHCVPGFQHQFFQWREENINGYGALPGIQRRNFIEVPENDELRQHICQVPMRKGALLIWNSMLPHGNFPNQSKDEFRMVQYIKMIPVDDSREFEPAISSCSFNNDEWFPENYEISSLGKRLYGIEDWDTFEVE